MVILFPVLFFGQYDIIDDVQDSVAYGIVIGRQNDLGLVGRSIATSHLIFVLVIATESVERVLKRR